LSVFLLAALGLSVAAAPAHAQSQTGEAQSLILEKLSVVNIAPLHFGTLAPGLTGGTVRVRGNNGSKNTTGSVVALANDHSRAQFLTYGVKGYFVTIAAGLPPTLTRVGGTETMVMSVLDIGGPAQRGIGQTGILPINVGGTLLVGGNQAGGTYVGTFTLTVIYL
jgi:hypothetical protein